MAEKIDVLIPGWPRTGKTEFHVNFSRQGKHREFSQFDFLHRENFENLEFYENVAI